MTEARSQALDAIRARHTRNPYQRQFCRCGREWPCDTAPVFAALDASEQERQRLQQISNTNATAAVIRDEELGAAEAALQQCQQERDEARLIVNLYKNQLATVERLRAALRNKLKALRLVLEQSPFVGEQMIAQSDALRVVDLFIKRAEQESAALAGADPDALKEKEDADSLRITPRQQSR
jgi:hypothetical protein